LILIDHQPFQFAGLRSHDTQTIINNVVGLAKAAKIFGVPTLLSTVVEERGGYLIKQLQDVFPEQKPIDRTFINTWEDERVVAWVRRTGRKKIVMAALWTEICLAMPVIQALGEGYEVYIVTDASGGVSVEAHEMAIQRMVQAGAVPITWTVFGSELQRDWARTATVAALAQTLVDHMGNVGTSFVWEQQLLNTPSEEKSKSAVGV
jgi:nicotinamidase-related amidase